MAHGRDAARCRGPGWTRRRPGSRRAGARRSPAPRRSEREVGEARDVVDGLDGDSRHGGAYYTIAANDVRRAARRRGPCPTSAHERLLPALQRPLPDLPSAAPPAADSAARPLPRAPGRARPGRTASRIGFVAALVETTQKVLTQPVRLLRVDAGHGRDRRAAAVTASPAYVGVVVAALYQRDLPGARRLPRSRAWPSAASCAARCLLRSWAGRRPRAPGGLRAGLRDSSACSSWLGHLPPVPAAVRRRTAGLRGHLPGDLLRAGRRSSCSIIPLCGGLIAGVYYWWSSPSSAWPRPTASARARPRPRCCCRSCSCAAAARARCSLLGGLGIA